MKKGFTLVELLAVIVILAIIALIATPLIIDIINDSKQSVIKRSIENYIHAAELSIYQDAVEGNNLSDGYYNIETLDINVDGEIPDYGYVQIKNGKIVGYDLSIDNKYYSNNGNKIVETNKNPMNKNYELSIDYINNKIIKGISFSYENALTFNFYIDKSKIKNKNIFLRVTNETRYASAASLLEEIKEYKQTDKYIIFSYDNLRFQEFTNNTLFEIVTEDGTVIDSINYDVSTYAKNIVYTTTNEYEKDVLIALTNLGAAIQNQFNYKTDDLAYKVLKEEDKNINTLTEKGLDLYNEISAFNIDIENNTNQVFTDIGITVRDPSINISNNISITISFRKSKNFLEEEKSKFGYILFDEIAYNNLKSKGIKYFNINSKEIFEIINIENNKTKVTISKVNLSFSYPLSIKYLSHNLFVLPYYLSADGTYKYGTLVKYSPTVVAKNYIDKTTSNENLKNAGYSIINFVATIK